jgi:hypothetical protein
LKQAVVFGPQRITVSDNTTNRWLLDVAPDSELVYIGVVPYSNSTGPVRIRFALTLPRNLVTTRYEIQLPHMGVPTVGTTGGFTKAAVWLGRFRIPRDEQYTLEIGIHNRSGSDQSWSAVVIMELEDND